MGLFGRGDEAAKREKALAKALARRGVAAEARIVSMRETGAERGGGAAREIEFRLAFAPAGGERLEVSCRQFMNDLTLTGLAPGEPAEILYDREDPSSLIVRKSPRYALIRNPAQAFDGRPAVAVPVAEPGALPKPPPPGE